MFSSGQRIAWHTRRNLLSAWALACLFLWLAGGPAVAFAFETSSIALRSLPFEAQSTFRTIARGGPFPYAKDGIVFGNRELRLPREPRGYYREYTVRTAGISDRGARRIVCGGPPPSHAETCWYSTDHYNSFARIVP